MDGTLVFEDAGKPKRYREAQGLWVEFQKPRKVERVRIEVSAAKVAGLELATCRPRTL